MNILIVTIDEPFYTPVFLEPVIKARQKDISAIAIISPFSKKKVSEGISDTPLGLLLTRIKYYGLCTAARQFMLFGIYKVIDIFSGFLQLNRQFSIKSLIKKYSIPKISCKANSINTKEFIGNISKYKPDVIICLVPQIAKKDFLNAAKIGCLNIHCSLLPKNQGREPLFWAMLREEECAGVTIHFMSDGIDMGDIVAQKPVKIDKSDSLHTLYLKAIRQASRLLVDCLYDIERGSANRVAQDVSFASYNKWPTPDDVKLFKKKGLRFF